MEYETLLMMKDNLNKLIKRKKLKNKFIIVFGNNQPAEEIVTFLENKQIKVNAIIDNNINKTGLVFHGISINLPEQILKPYKKDAVILIASEHYNAMLLQLNTLGYQEKKQVLKIIELNRFGSNLLDLNTFFMFIKRIKYGEKIFNTLVNTYKKPEGIFICPVSSLGDTYIALAYLVKYLEFNKKTNVIITVVGNACAKVANLFMFYNVKVLSQNDVEALIQYVIFYRKNSDNIKILHHRYPYTCIFANLGNYKNTSFSELFKYSILSLDNEISPAIPRDINKNLLIDNQRNDEIYKKIKEFNIIKNKTVIISPYANTAANIPETFWINLVHKLQQEGFIVLTNSSSPNEPAIEGTQAIFVELDVIINIIEYAGIFIALRSGICDVISSAQCKKIILYPDRVYRTGSFKDFFSLINMELSNHLYEHLYLESNSSELLSNIIYQCKID